MLSDITNNYFGGCKINSLGRSSPEQQKIKWVWPNKVKVSKQLEILTNSLTFDNDCCISSSRYRGL